MAQRRYWYLPEHALLVTQNIGTPTADEIKQFSVTLSQEPAIQGPFNMLVDNRHAQMRLTFDDMDAISRYVQTLPSQGLKKVAVLVNTPANFGIGRMADAVFDAHGIEHQPFYHLGEALRWLDLPADIELPATIRDELLDEHQDEPGPRIITLSKR